MVLIKERKFLEQNSNARKFPSRRKKIAIMNMMMKKKEKMS